MKTLIAYYAFQKLGIVFLFFFCGTNSISFSSSFFSLFLNNYILKYMRSN